MPLSRTESPVPLLSAAKKGTEFGRRLRYIAQNRGFHGSLMLQK